ncbi:MAG: type II toxin-antitoxin system HigB family toxin [Taibaiella sp.]|nr:type II toxin-antitoxin system HigB family toxin [Taibaiella sp.]
MNVIVKRSVLFYIDKYPSAKKSLLTWYKEFSAYKFENFNELKCVYGSASIISNSRVIFNIKGNDYRLLVSVNFIQAAAYIIWFRPHKEYDEIDSETVVFDEAMLKYGL